MASVANKGFMSNAGFVVTSDGVVVFDALGTPALGRAMVAAIAKVTRKPIRRVIVSHYHADHIYGLQALKAAGAEIWAHRKAQAYLASPQAAERLAQRRNDLFPWVDGDTAVVAPDLWLDGDTGFRMGGLTFRVLYSNGAHSPEDVMMYVVEDRLLFAGDLIFAGRIPFVGNADSAGWLTAMDVMIGLAPAVVVPGHGQASRNVRPRLEPHTRVSCLSAQDDGRGSPRAFAVRRRLCANRLVAIPRPAGVRAGQSHQRVRDVSAYGTGAVAGEHEMSGAASADSMLAVAARAARTAGSIVLDAARDLRRLPSFSKEHAEVVSAAEMEAEDAIVAAIRGAYPEHAVLGEESSHIEGAREGSGYRWLVDPIDGAVNFAHGYPGYAVSIALLHGAEITHAVVLDPVRDELFQASRAKGATCNGATLHISACAQLADALVATVSPTRNDARLRSYTPSLSMLMLHCAGVRLAGSSALSLAHVAAGRVDAFWMTSLRPWDIAAGALLVKEAGGRIGDLAGAANFLRTNEVIASSPGVFNALRETIASARIV